MLTNHLGQKYYSVLQTAKLLQIHPSSVYALIKANKLPAFKYVRAWHVKETDINKYLELVTVTKYGLVTNFSSSS